MKKLTTLVFVLLSLTLWGQKEIITTTEFLVSGQIENEFNVTLYDLEQLQSKAIPDVAISNHKGNPRGVAKQLKGVLVKELLKDMQLKVDSPKFFSEFYFTFTAIDDYKVVYSWNEIFNSPTGDNLYIITERDGKKLREMDQRILILTPSDFQTGRRHIKGLSKIIVARVD